MFTWSCLGLSFEQIPLSSSLACSLTATSPLNTMFVVLFLVSPGNWYFEFGETYIFVDTSVLFHCLYAFILPILEHCSPVWGSAAECHLQLLERQVYSVARPCPDQNFLSLCQGRHVSGQYMLYKVNSNSNHYLFIELPSVSTILNQKFIEGATLWIIGIHRSPDDHH